MTILHSIAWLRSTAESCPKGPFLLAEIGGELVAAAHLDLNAEPLSDPFLPTANLRELLKLRACHIRRSAPGRRSHDGNVERPRPRADTPSQEHRRQDDDLA